MTSTPRIVRAAARALSKEPETASTSSDAAREETVLAIKAALHTRAAARRRRRWVMPAVAISAAAAIALLVASGVLRSTHHVATTSPSVAGTSAPAAPSLQVERVHGAVAAVDRREQTRSVLTEGASVKMGDRIVTTDGTATIGLPSGSHVDVERESALAVTIAGGIQSVSLENGTVTSRVAKVHPGERFLVHAGDVEVEVRGTVFRVERRTHSRCGTLVKVDVLEGRVAVRGPNVDRMLSAGESWATECAEETPKVSPSALASSPAAISIPTPRATTSAVVASPSSKEPPASSSELAAQNALFGEAMAAKSHGDTATAIAKLDTFVQKYPASPLYEAAAGQRLRLLASSDPARARAAAHDYVARFPNGFARKDADAVLADAPPNQK